jgi:hypothetical protein
MKKDGRKIKSQKTNFWIATLAIVTLFLLFTWGQYSILSRSYNYANQDFMSLWGGGRALLEGLNPYDPEVWQPLRARYGSTWMPTQAAPFPVWTAVFLVPFALLPINLAASAWLTFSEIALGVCAYLLLTYAENTKITRLSFLLVVFSLFTYRATVVTLLNGQITVALLLIVVLFLILLKRNKPQLAGFVFAFLALKPNPFLLFVPLIAVWLLIHKRWKVITGGVMGGALLLILGWLVLPGWIADWMHASEMAVVAPRTPTVWGIGGDVAFSYWQVIGLTLVIIVTFLVGLMTVGNKTLEITHVVSLGLIASLLITPYAWAYEHVLLLVPLLLLFPYFNRSWVKRALWLGMVVGMPWWLYWVASKRGMDTLSFLVPLMVGCVYYWLAVRKHSHSDSISPAR